MRRTRATILALPILLAGLVGSPVSAGSSTIHVDDDGLAGPGGCGGAASAPETIQGGVDEAGPGDTVIVCPGEYEERVIIDGDRDGMTLRASSKWVAKLIGQPPVTAGIEDDTVLLVRDVRDVTIQWLVVAVRMSGPCPEWEDMIAGRSARGIRVQGNHIRPIGSNTNGPCSFSDGIDLEDSPGGLISSNLVRDFTSDGIVVQDARATIRNNSIRYFHATVDPNDLDGDAGIEMDGPDGIITHNSVRTNGAYPDGPDLEYGIQVDGPRALIRDNRVRGSGDGLAVDGGDARVVRNDIAETEEGIDVDSEGNVLRRNVSLDNDEEDCIDLTSGSGTSGTANTWEENIGVVSEPVGICSPPTP